MKCETCGKDMNCEEYTYNGVTWSTKLLLDGKSMKQSEWNAYLEDTPWRLPTLKEYESLLGCPNKSFMEKLKKDLTEYWLMTKDEITNPFNGEMRPVVLGVNVYGRFDIDADYGIGKWPARGVKK